MQRRGGDARSQYELLSRAVVDEVEDWTTKKMLDESEKYRELIEKSLVRFFVVKEGKIKFANSEFCNIFGYSSEDLIGVDFSELVVDEDEDRIREDLRKKEVGSEGSSRYQFKAVRGDETEIWVDVITSSTEYEGEAAVQGTLVDCPKYFQENWKDPEPLLGIIDKLAFLMDEEGKVAYCNDNVVESFSCLREELEGIYIEEAPKKIGVFSQEEN